VQIYKLITSSIALKYRAFADFNDMRLHGSRRPSFASLIFQKVAI